MSVCMDNLDVCFLEICKQTNAQSVATDVVGKTQRGDVKQRIK